MQKLFKNREECYGCGACANVCIRNAIVMKEDEQGFLYPRVDLKLCVECGLCKKACQIGKETDNLNDKVESCYGIKNCATIRLKSSSGGIYTMISDFVLNKKGVCAGVRFDNKFNVVHEIASSTEERNFFRGSKYVQSDTQKIFIQIAECLKKKQLVLFTGTPCQVNGLKCFLVAQNINEQFLLTNDLICHGVPSPRVWKSYVSFLENKYNSKLTEFTFRDKSVGWREYHISAKFEDGQVIGDNEYTQTYVKLFGRDLMLRPSCYRCPYACLQRAADITIGDFWGIEKIDENFTDNVGVSMVFFNSVKGMEVLEHIKHEDKISLRKYLTGYLKQSNLYEPTKKSVYYNQFWKAYQQSGYKKVVEKYGGCGKRQKWYLARDIIDYKILKRK